MSTVVEEMIVPYYQTNRFTLYEGDCRSVLPSLAENSVDSIVCDPPYHLTQASRAGSPRNNDPETPYGRTRIGERGFMGKTWDGGDVAHDPAVWNECLRVLKPGGHLLAFGGSRTYHRLVCAIEDSGFEIRDQIQWLYGSGFPKSLDVSKAIDRYKRRDYVMAAIEMGFVGPQRSLDDWTREDHSPGDRWWGELKKTLTPEQWGAVERRVIGEKAKGATSIFGNGKGAALLSEPATHEAQEWNGWGTALKPAHEPIVLARKPLIGTVAENVLKHGTGGLNIDGCRIETGDVLSIGSNNRTNGAINFGMKDSPEAQGQNAMGRWPSNVCHDGSEEVLAGFPDAPGQQGDLNGQSGRQTSGMYGDSMKADRYFNARLDSGSAARFSYCAKADNFDRNEGLHGLRNGHPTVKPISLARYLCRLITPPNGLVLDPFVGSGSLGIGALLEGFSFIGIEKESDYCEIAKRRLQYWDAHYQPELFRPDGTPSPQACDTTDTPQLSLLVDLQNADPATS